MTSTTGIVEKTDKNWAWVTLFRQAGCGHCGTGLLPKSNRDAITVKAENKLNANTGDTVVLITNDSVLKWSSVFFLLPLLTLLLGVLVSIWVADWLHADQNISVLLGLLAGVVAGLLLSRQLAVRLNANDTKPPFVTRVIRHTSGNSPLRSSGNFGCPLCQ